ncbi:Uncharacterised protein [Mycobacteroides abscessus subsp. abscessus]|uniref:hypothetical protein n=1 Tax=Mycobacteroides abscessus TaxID=36809 RepID=UPI00092BED15|nr:hypothetical protein [Mycobacteroides abscessus]SHX68567.1 Uncharacterised protein [Mycobacteroides abscessus subsp. abscessus]SIC57862.1 Uncharacterised protein [Mycobacteroides abscessus subsp. abscessus]SKK19385.1 Uncharacterised protein [Mycobacteroides abscessus subsp. abscessus]SKP48903.1 Uncharacterised protein [Mycobacteroides abscessus subsp. abscessus]
MITEIRLVSNDGASTAKFWGAVFNVPPVDLGGGRWRVTPVAGPAVSISTARVVEAITRVDLTVVSDPAAADRLRALDFEVAHDGSQAVDVNGTDSTVHLVARGQEGHSDVPWEEPIPERPVRDDAYYEQLSDAVERGDYRAVGPVELGEESET